MACCTHTPAYVVQEVFSKKGYDGAKSDIWSCGIVLYVLLSGYLPFQHENVMKIFKAEFVFPPWISMDVKKLISRVLIAEDDKRITFSSIMKNPWFRKGFDREFSRCQGIQGEDGEKSGGRRKGKLAEVYEVAPEVTVVELLKSAGDSVKYRKLCEEDVRPGLEDIVWSWQVEAVYTKCLEEIKKREKNPDLFDLLGKRQIVLQGDHDDIASRIKSEIISNLLTDVSAAAELLVSMSSSYQSGLRMQLKTATPTLVLVALLIVAPSSSLSVMDDTSYDLLNKCESLHAGTGEEYLLKLD
ncbi:hypothetical protein Q3G72_003806 [Acer saccharum]|nr:hypothetical protein Q3G72_003806 [Acer saccharum]